MDIILRIYESLDISDRDGLKIFIVSALMPSLFYFIFNFTNKFFKENIFKVLLFCVSINLFLILLLVFIKLISNIIFLAINIKRMTSLDERSLELKARLESKKITEKRSIVLEKYIGIIDDFKDKLFDLKSMISFSSLFYLMISILLIVFVQVSKLNLSENTYVNEITIIRLISAIILIASIIFPFLTYNDLRFELKRVFLSAKLDWKKNKSRFTK